MEPLDDISAALSRLEERLLAIESKLDSLTMARRKSMEWIATMSERVSRLDAFRDEVRTSFEPLVAKMDGIDEITCILRHATSDVARRVETLERDHRNAS